MRSSFKTTRTRYVSIADGVLYAADSVRGRIVAVNLTDLSLDVIYRTTDDLQLHTVAASRRHVYFSAWNRKYGSARGLH